MNPSSAVFASVVVIVSSTIVRRLREGKWQGHVLEIIIFGFLLLIALQIMALVVPNVAKVLAYLGMVGAFVLNGPAVFGYLGDLGGNKQTRYPGNLPSNRVLGPQEGYRGL